MCQSDETCMASKRYFACITRLCIWNTCLVFFQQDQSCPNSPLISFHPTRGQFDAAGPGRAEWMMQQLKGGECDEITKINFYFSRNCMPRLIQC